MSATDASRPERPCWALDGDRAHDDREGLRPLDYWWKEKPVTDKPRYQTLDANEAVAGVAYRLSEVFAIYPITPASVMGEHADSWSADRRANLWGTVPEVVEMQSEGGTRARRASTTISHLRFGPRPIRSTYRISRAQFSAA